MANTSAPNSIYHTVASDDFAAMLDIERHAGHNDEFDALISASHDHFWDPLDSRYIDFDQTFDLKNEYLLPPQEFRELRSAVVDKLDEGQKIGLANDIMHWALSNSLHGEQGGVFVSAMLCNSFTDPRTQEFAANQAREEARHVAAFSRYIRSRWGAPQPVGGGLETVMFDIMKTPNVGKKITGMQIIVEGLAMGSLSFYHTHSRDPVLRRLAQLALTDEAFHHKFGKIWSASALPAMTPEEHNEMEDWAVQCFEHLLLNLSTVRQRPYIYEKYGLDWKWVEGACNEISTDDDRMAEYSNESSMFRILIKTLLNAGFITERTRPIYARWFDMKELRGESESVIGNDIAEEGIAFLKEVNKGRKAIGKR